MPGPFRILACLGLLAGLTALWAQGARAAEPPPPLIIVLDGSGSMWGNLGTDKLAKFDLIRAALRKSLATVSPASRIGLVSYGHRRRSDCGDVEAIALPDAGPAERVLTLVDKVSPRGKGPLSLALREAARLAGPQPANLLLVSDGPDNCQQDPCAAVVEIAKANPRLVVHVLALGLDPPDLQRMKCIARATRGKLFDVRDGAALATATDEAVKLANLAAPPRPVKPGDAAGPSAESAKPAEPPGLRLTAGLSDGGPALTAPLKWKVMKDGAEGSVVLERTAAALNTDIEPGTYVVEASQGFATARQTVEVTKAGPVARQLDLDAGILKLEARATKTLDALGDPLVTIFAKPTADGDAKLAPHAIWLGRNADAEMVVPAGTYRVRAEDGHASRDLDVDVAAGEAALAQLVLGTGRLDLTAVAVAGGPELSDVTFTVTEDDPDSPQGKREIARTADPRPSFVLAAGTYHVSARTGTAEVSQLIAVDPGSAAAHAIALNVSRVTVSAVLDGAPVPPGLAMTFRVLTPTAPPRELARSTNSPAEFLLAAGKYRIEVQAGTRNLKGFVDTDIGSGKDVKIGLRLESGLVTVEPGGGQESPWELRDERGRVVLRAGPTGRKSERLAPGRYALRKGDASPEVTFDLKAGEQRTVEVAP